MERNRNAYNDNGFVKMKYKLVKKKGILINAFQKSTVTDLSLYNPFINNSIFMWARRLTENESKNLWHEFRDNYKGNCSI